MKKGISLMALCLLGFLPGRAQEEKKQDYALDGLRFRELGPALTSGRIADIAVNPENHNQYYLAVASGGVWKTDNHGVTYESIFDAQASYSIGCVSLAPTNPNIVWVGSGENNNQRSVAYGDGVYKSEDGGKSWKNMGLKASEHIGMIRIHPKDPQTVYVAAYGPLWSAGGDRGIYKSEDGGENWKQVLFVSENTGFNEIHFDPRDPEVLYATAHQRRRHVWTYVSGGPESALYKSEDGGKNWRQLKGGLPSGDLGRIALAIPPADPDRIYAMIEGHGTYRSDDRGASFRKLNGDYTSGNYYVELVPDPVDPDRLYSMDTYMHQSIDGGATWQRVPEKNKHVDNHCLWINPQDPRQMIAGCDGGVYESYDRGGSWHYKDNLPVTQFYRVTADNSEPFYYVYGGTQDNFSLGGPSQTINSRGIVNSDWFVTNTGDGFESQIDPENPNIIYAQAQYGWLVRYDKLSGESVGLKPSPGKGEKAYRWNWDAPLLISPHQSKRLYFAANKVFRSDDRGDHWEVISPDLSAQINRNQLKVMGELQSKDAIALHNSTSIYGNIVSLDESPLQEGLLYVGTDDGLIQVSEDGGKNWRKQSEFPGIPPRTYVQQVLADRFDDQVVYALFNNHKNGDFKPYILRSNDRGRSWQALQGNLPERGSLYSLRQDHQKAELLFVGTEFGLYVSLQGGEHWQALKAGLPPIAIRDVEIQEREDDLILASFGRGIYILDDYSALRGMSAEIAESESHLFPIKKGRLVIEASPLGYGAKGFLGASYYTAPNPERGVSFPLYLKELEPSLKSKRQKAEKEAHKKKQAIEYPSLSALRAEEAEESSYLLMIITDAEEREVRRLSAKPKAGLQRYHWDGRLGNRSYLASQGEPITKAGAANYAPPGEYEVEFFLSENGILRPLNQKARFELEWLPGHSFPASDWAALAAFQDSLESSRRLLVGYQQKFEALKKRQTQLKALARNTPGAALSLLQDLKGLEKGIEAIEISLKGDALRSSLEMESKPGLNSRMSTAVWNSYSTRSAPTGEQRKALKIIDQSLPELGAELKQLESQLEEYYQILLNSGAPILDGEF